MKINERLLWDYSFSEEERQKEPFRRWYVNRVLTRGGIHDIQGIGLKAIHDLFPALHLPPKIRRFWEWFFSLPDTQSRYGHFNAAPKDIHP